MATNQELRAEVKGLKAEMNGLKEQMSEIMRILLSLKSGNGLQFAQQPPHGLPLGYTPPANQDATQGAGHVAIHGNVQSTSVGSEEVFGEPKVQTPQPIIIPHTVEAPQIQGYTSENSAYPQVQPTAPVMAPTFQSHQAVFNLHQGYSSEHQQTKEKFQIEVNGPNRIQLRNMAQKNKETFGEYALRWKDMAAQVFPSLLEEERVDIFMSTLPPLYYDKLIESVYASFEDLVLAGESLENGAKRRKIAYSSAEATLVAGHGNVSYSPKTFPQNPHSSLQTRKSQETPYYPEKKHIQFDPIPMSYTDLFNYLHTNKLISTRPVRPDQPPYFQGYDPNAACAFHEGAVGHVVENCKTFKIIVQDMIDTKRITFRQESPDITADNCSEAKKNEETSAAADKGKAPQCGFAPMSYTALCSYLISHEWVTPRKMGPIQPPFPRGYNPEVACEFHLGAIGHSTENCPTLRCLIQGLIDTNQLTFEKGEGSSSQGLWTIKQE